MPWGASACIRDRHLLMIGGLTSMIIITTRAKADDLRLPFGSVF
ncbi:hypothetical protein [Ralstonia pickettii]|nr:hypothetical protein [Ralstonia pickettii]